MARLTPDDRKRIKKMYDADVRTVEMAVKLGCSTTAIYDELKRGFDGADKNDRPIYNPDLAQRKINANAKRCRDPKKPKTVRRKPS